MKTVTVRSLEQNERKWATDLIRNSWGAENVVTRGRVIEATKLPGFIALKEERPVGLLTYNITGRECEIVTMNSLMEGKGVGTEMISALKSKAKKEGCKRLWLITTNDNMGALRFYQKRGFRLVNLYRNSMEDARKMKPEIPLFGYNGIPVHDEIELEMLFNDELEFEMLL